MSGLVTAWKLLERGWEVDVFEREPFYGGMARTWRWGEFLLDVGPHLYHTPDEKLAEFWDREFGDLFVKGEFWCKNVKGGNFDEFYDYPLSFEAIAQFPSELKQRVFSELEHVNPADRARARSYKEYVQALVGPTLQEMFYETYPEKIWGLTTGEMTPLWAPKRIELRQRSTPFYHGQWNAVGKYGTGCVLDRIHSKVRDLGGKIWLEREVTGLDRNGTAVRSLKLGNGDNVDVAPGDVIVSTLPISALSRFLDIPCSLRFRGITSVYLAFEREHVIPEGLHWLYYDSPELWFNRLSEQKKFSAECAVPGKTCITAEIAYSKGDKFDDKSEQELVDTVLEQVCRTGLVESSEFIAGTVNRQPAVYPLLAKDYQHELAEVQSQLGKYSQLYSIGTTGEFSYADQQILFLKSFDLVDLLTDQHSEFSQVKRKKSVTNFNPKVELGNRVVGAGERPFIVAEAGLNHNGNLDIAEKLIDAAAEAGCDAVKFQTYRSANRISSRVKKVRYAETVIGTEETLLETFERLELSPEDHVRLFKYARGKGIEIFSTPFDFESVDLLESLDAPFYKVASFDLVNTPLLRRLAATGKPLILSTGMSTLGDIEEALDAVRSEGNSNVILLHCVSAYPAAPEDMNLNAIRTMKQAFGVPVGLSDHTLGVMVSQIALAVGADIVERHFTMDRTLEGPDHILSSEPEEMRMLVRCASLIDRVLGDGVKAIRGPEYDTINTQRKSLYAATNIRKGDLVTAEKIAVKGPGGGLQPRYSDIIVGRVARRDVQADHPITWEDI